MEWWVYHLWKIVKEPRMKWTRKWLCIIESECVSIEATLIESIVTYSSKGQAHHNHRKSNRLSLSLVKCSVSNWLKRRMDSNWIMGTCHSVIKRVETNALHHWKTVVWISKVTKWKLVSSFLSIREKRIILIFI